MGGRRKGSSSLNSYKMELYVTPAGEGRWKRCSDFCRGHRSDVGTAPSENAAENVRCGLAGASSPQRPESRQVF